jgi:hypothetical protein
MRVHDPAANGVPELPGRTNREERTMNAAGWTISIIAILIVAAIALRTSRHSR